MLGKGQIDAQLVPLFRTDGSPKYVHFSRPTGARTYPSIVVDVVKSKERMKRQQRHVSVLSAEVVPTWAKTADVWLVALGMTNRSTLGKATRQQFLAGLEAFLRRYGVKTAHQWVFTETSSKR